ncbi:MULTISPECIES: hypothetical protein [Pseudomonas]|jgi:hypothetical protein|uniref:hypothetical protein n=1 Tax=Pseudomonas TaxID=286 RepID=UPI0018D94CB1|nr:hypothetical protein [Pseudomonas asiatica]MBH3382326.1 hypothetical protein [Pseudomonas asiatica]
MLKRKEPEIFVSHIPVQETAILVLIKPLEKAFEHRLFEFIELCLHAGELFAELCFFMDGP